METYTPPKNPYTPTNHIQKKNLPQNFYFLTVCYQKNIVWKFKARQLFFGGGKNNSTTKIFSAQPSQIFRLLEETQLVQRAVNQAGNLIRDVLQFAVLREVA